MPDDLTRAGLRLAAAQAGVVRRQQLLTIGWSERTLSRRIRAGLWQPHGRRVLVLAGTASGLLRDSLIVGHQLYPRGELTGFSALSVRGQLEQELASARVDPLPWVRVPDNVRVKARVLRRSGGGHVGQVLGVPVATTSGALMDLLRLLPEPDAHDLLLLLARQRGSATMASLMTDDLSHVGAGSRQLRRLLPVVLSGAHSQAEERLVQLLVEAGVDGFIANYPVSVSGHDYRIDVAFPAARLAIEVDGRAFHSDAGTFQRDRTRQNRLIAAGWRLLRFTWEDLTLRPEHVLGDIAHFLP